MSANKQLARAPQVVVHHHRLEADVAHLMEHLCAEKVMAGMGMRHGDMARLDCMALTCAASCLAASSWGECRQLEPPAATMPAKSCQPILIPKTGCAVGAAGPAGTAGTAQQVQRSAPLIRSVCSASAAARERGLCGMYRCLGSRTTTRGPASREDDLSVADSEAALSVVSAGGRAGDGEGKRRGEHEREHEMAGWRLIQHGLLVLCVKSQPRRPD